MDVAQMIADFGVSGLPTPPPTPPTPHLLPLPAVVVPVDLSVLRMIALLAVELVLGVQMSR